jgi:type IV secretory pathway TrbL component
MFCGPLGFLLVVLLLKTSNFGIKLVFNLLGVGIEIFLHALPIGMSNRYMFLS